MRPRHEHDANPSLDAPRESWRNRGGDGNEARMPLLSLMEVVEAPGVLHESTTPSSELRTGEIGGVGNDAAND